LEKWVAIVGGLQVIFFAAKLGENPTLFCSLCAGIAELLASFSHKPCKYGTSRG